MHIEIICLLDAEHLRCCHSYNPGPALQPIHKNLYICNGNENDLSECRMTVYGGSPCSRNQAESIICRKLINSKLVCVSTVKCFQLGCPMEDQFPCEDSQGNLLCVSELNYCDGVSDCGDGSDEPSDCSDGTHIDYTYHVVCPYITVLHTSGPCRPCISHTHIQCVLHNSVLLQVLLGQFIVLTV